MMSVTDSTFKKGREWGCELAWMIQHTFLIAFGCIAPNRRIIVNYMEVIVVYRNWPIRISISSSLGRTVCIYVAQMTLWSSGMEHRTQMSVCIQRRKYTAVICGNIDKALTTAQVGGERSASRPSRFIPGREPPVLIRWEVGRALELAWTTWRGENYH
jgi:hypothetical protein